MIRIPKLLELNAFSITVYYLTFALLWILLSDQILTWITDDPLLISRYQTYKGIFYVLITGLFLYLLIQKSNEHSAAEKERIDSALYAAGMATWSIDLKTKKIRRSQFHYTLFDLSENPKNWDLQTFYEHIHPDDRQHVEEQIEKTINQEIDTFQARYRLNQTKNAVKWLESRGNMIFNDEGEPIQLAGVVSDITERKIFEEEYAREKELFESLFEQIPVIIDIYDPEINEIRVNRAFEKYLGWTNQEIKEIDLMKACYPDPKTRKKAAQSMKEATGEWHEFEVQNKAGETRIQSWSNIRLSDKTIVGIGLDITELKTSQREIRESRELLKKTFESLKESVIILDPETRKITDCNKSTTEIFGYSGEELIGSSTRILHVSEEHFKEFAEIGKKELERDGFFQTEFVMKHKNGSQFYSDHTISLVKNQDGEIEKIVSVIRDITDNKKHRERLQELTDRYRRAEEIAGIGHWERNLKTDEAIWSEGFYNVIGLKPGERDTSYQSMLDMIHPKDREEYDAAFKESLKEGALDVRYRLIKPSTGEVGYYHELAETSYDEDGNPDIISGTIQDMTKLEEFQIKLHKRNQFIETTLENLPIGVAVNLIDEGTVTLMNNKFTEIYGWSKEVLADTQAFFKKVYPDEAYRQKIVDMVMADIDSQDPERMEWSGIKITTQEGEERIVNAKNIPVYDQNLMISTVVDVTAQFNAEQRLAESEHNYRLLFQKSPLPMWIYDPETLSFIEVNNAAVKHYGYSRKEFHGMTLLDIRPEEERKKFKSRKESEDFFSNKAGEWKHLKKSGEVISVLITGSSIDYFGKDYRLILVNDITEQKKAEEMVLASLVEGENKERARIARELHDGLGQYLAAANMNLDALQSEMENLDQRKQKQFMKGLTLLKHAVTETAQISRNLLPRVVDDYGLALAIKSLVDSYSNSTETDITYYENLDELELDRNIELNLYRIAQESLSNAVKYAQATKINVQLIKDELDLILTIDDNGKGFDSSADGFSGGLGLQTIKTRTGALGGELEIDSKPGKGTFIHVIVPIKNNKI